MNSFTAQVVLFGWLPMAAAVFALLRPRDAVLTVFVAGWLFLPVATVRLSGAPDYGKMEATCLGALAGVMLFDAHRLARFRAHWIDLPLLLWCIAPIPTSLSNDLGLYDGLSGTFAKSVHYGIPILLGRIYLGDREGLLRFAKALCLGAMVYMPLCWLEIRMSPQLHHWVYGYIQHSFVQMMRYGGYRPLVFLQHGIAVSVFYATAAGMLFWLWRTGSLRRLAGIPVSGILAAMIATLIGCKTATGLALFGLMVSCFWIRRIVPIRLLLFILVFVSPAYMAFRLTNAVPAATVVQSLRPLDPQRADSLGVRLRQEDLFSEHTANRPLFGWGAWERNIPKDSDGHPLVQAVDGFWTIALSQYGLFGLAAVTSLTLAVPALVAWRFSSPVLDAPSAAPMVGMCLVLCVITIDNLFNAMPNPLFYLGMGGLAQMAIAGWSASPVSSPESAPLVSRRLVMGSPQPYLKENPL